MFPQTINKQQQSAEQTMLFNAIKNKFANNNENQSGTSPPVFSIPSLRLPQFPNEKGTTQSKLNQFVHSQLSENKNLTNSGAFAIPILQLPNKLNGTPLTLVEKLMNSESNINALNKGLSDLRVCDEVKPGVIDLTTALNTPSSLQGSPSRQLATVAPNPIDFQIPFIDCDLREAALRLPSKNEYCQTDVSDFKNSRFIIEPSRFGKITCLKYKIPRRIHCIDHSFKVKYEITRFAFDTKSPDDIVLASLRKYNKI